MCCERGSWYAGADVTFLTQLEGVPVKSSRSPVGAVAPDAVPEPEPLTASILGGRIEQEHVPKPLPVAWRWLDVEAGGSGSG
jgi:hypothetical protein